MNTSLSSIWTIARKEFYEYLKTKRLLIIGGLYAILFLLAVGIMSYYGSKVPIGISKFRYFIASSHSITSIFYIILPIVLAYDLIVRERSRKSIYTLLSKPINREEVMIGKFLGVLLIICIVIIPVATIGHLIASAYLGIPSLESIWRAYACLGIILLGTTCYISLAMLFSVITRTTVTSLISSLIVGWVGLNVIWPISMMFFMLSGHSNEMPLYVKIAYAISPSNCMNAAQRILSEHLFGSIHKYPISIFQSIISLLIFFVAMFVIAILLFRHKELT